MVTQVHTNEQTSERFHAHWDRRIDQLAVGMLGDDEFIGEMMGLDRDARESPWAVIAIMDRRVKRGQLNAELFRGIEARVAQREFARPELDKTIDMPMAPQALERTMELPRMPAAYDRTIEMPPSAPAPRVSTQRIRKLTPEQFQAAGLPAQDAPAAPPPEVPMVTELGAGSVVAERYVIRGLIGEGGLGRVYQALDRARRDRGELDWHVAIKVLNEGTQDPQALARLQREFESIWKLNHRNIVRVFELGRDGPLDFFTMEFLVGEPLAKFLARFHGEPVPRDEAWTMMRDIGAALVHAHDIGVVHGDLTPQNIMMLKSGELKVLDFGAAAADDVGQVTPAYASLELLAGAAPDPRDDLYALACLGYELLAGTHPYGERRASEARSLGLVPAQPRGLTPEQWDLLQQGLAFERAARPESVRAWLMGLGLKTAPAPVSPRKPFVFEKAAASAFAVEMAPAVEPVIPEASISEAAEAVEPVEVAAPAPVVAVAGEPVVEVPPAAVMSAEDREAETSFWLKPPAEAQRAEVEMPADSPAEHPVEVLMRADLQVEPVDEVEQPAEVAGWSTAEPAVGPADVPSYLEATQELPRVSVVPALDPADTLIVLKPRMEDVPAQTPFMPSLPSDDTEQVPLQTERMPAPAPIETPVFRLGTTAVPDATPPMAAPAAAAAWPPLEAGRGVAAQGSAARKPSSTRVIAASAALLLVVLCAVFWYRQWPHETELPPVAATAPLRLAPAPEEAVPAPAPAAKATAPAPVSKPKPASRARPAAAPAGGTVSIAQYGYWVSPGAKFAEIKIVRTDASKPLNFTWWTEDGTALAGFDYLAQPKSTAFLATGARSATLFVKVAGNSPHKSPVKFTVVIARPSSGALGNARTTVTVR